MKLSIKALFCLLSLFFLVQSSFGQTWSTTNVSSTNLSTVTYATTGNVTVATLTNYLSGSTLVYTYATPISAGNGTMQIGFVGNFNSKYVYVSLTDNTGKVTTLDILSPVLSIAYNSTVTSVTPTENYSIDWNLVTNTGFDLTHISKVTLLLYNDATAENSPSLTSGMLAINLPVFGTGTTGTSTITNPTIGQEWGLESSGYLYSNNNHGVIVGSTTTNNVASLVSYPYYNFIVNGRTNFVANDNAIGIWSANLPASNYRHYLGIANLTFPNTTTEYSVINAYEWNSLNSLGHPKHLTIQNYSDPNLAGNVGIGLHTAPPLEKLSVNGNIRCKILYVTATNWADYVFENHYRLRSLDEVKNYIQKEKHLPGVPSEQDVISKGLDVNAMLKVQMEKIEELTLYIIQQQAELDALKTAVAKNRNK